MSSGTLIEEANMTDRTTDIAPRQRQQVPARRERGSFGHAVSVFDRFADEMDRLFDDFGFGRRSFGTPWRGSGASALTPAATLMWAPEIEVYQRDNDLVVRADLPGLKRDDVHVDITDTEITISGERQHERDAEREGVYRSERSYGSFCRTILLPEGAITDQAKATFRDGVLEITMPAPPQSTRARRLEIQEPAAQSSTPKK
jgi:HSP20 family protein